MKLLKSSTPHVRGQFARYISTSTPVSSRRAPNPRTYINTKGRAPGFARRIPPNLRPSRSSDPQHGPRQPPQHESPPTISSALATATTAGTNPLLAPVNVPDDPKSILPADHPATSLLTNSSIIIHRQLETMNLLLGFEQANKYVINDASGNLIGYLAEQEHGLGNALARQTFRTHRSFTTHVFDREGTEVLRLHRPFSWISSRIRVYDCLRDRTGTHTTSSALSGTGLSGAAQISDVPLQDMRVIGEAQQQWAPLRRRYNLFLQRDLAQTQTNADAPQLTSGDLPTSSSTALTPADPAKENLGFSQFASVDEPFLSWDFSLKSADDRLIGSVNRNFSGFAREIFTDTGVYAIRMDAAGLAGEPGHWISQTGRQGNTLEGDSEGKPGMTLDQRAVILATAVSIDFDYFSRTRGGVAGGGFMPMWFPMGGSGGEVEGAEAGAGAAGEAGQAGEAGEAGEWDAQSPQSSNPWSDGFEQPQEEKSPWDGLFGDDSGRGGGGGGGDAGGGGGGGDGLDLDDFF